MNADFPRVITLLRKERGISQKQAAGELGISQALLSHYEKGIRECGLDFLVRAADFYGVSSDYLLGRSPNPNGSTLSVDDLPEPDPMAKEPVSGPDGILPTMNKRLLINSLTILFSLLQKGRSKTLTKEVSSYLMLAVYRMFRAVYSAHPKNDRNMFTVPEVLYREYTTAAMSIAEGRAVACAAGQPEPGGEPVRNKEALAVTTGGLSADYPQGASSLLNLIQASEVRVHLLHKEEK